MPEAGALCWTWPLTGRCAYTIGSRSVRAQKWKYSFPGRAVDSLTGEVSMSAMVSGLADHMQHYSFQGEISVSREVAQCCEGSCLNYLVSLICLLPVCGDHQSQGQLRVRIELGIIVS